MVLWLDRSVSAGKGSDRNHLFRKIANVVGLELLACFVRVADFFKGFGGIGSSNFNKHGGASRMVVEIFGHIVDFKRLITLHQCLQCDGKGRTLIVKNNPHIVWLAMSLDLLDGIGRHGCSS